MLSDHGALRCAFAPHLALALLPLPKNYSVPSADEVSPNRSKALQQFLVMTEQLSHTILQSAVLFAKSSSAILLLRIHAFATQK